MNGAHPQVNQQVLALQFARKDVEVNKVLQAHNWAELDAKSNEIIRLYEEHNGKDKVAIRPGMSQKELEDATWVNEPLTIDPTEFGDIQQRLVKIDNDLKPFGVSVFQYPKTKRVATVLSPSPRQRAQATSPLGNRTSRRRWDSSRSMGHSRSCRLSTPSLAVLQRLGSVFELRCRSLA